MRMRILCSLLLLAACSNPKPSPEPKAPSPITVDTVPKRPRVICDTIRTQYGVDTLYCPANVKPTE